MLQYNSNHLTLKTIIILILSAFTISACAKQPTITSNHEPMNQNSQSIDNQSDFNLSNKNDKEYCRQILEEELTELENKIKNKNDTVNQCPPPSDNLTTENNNTVKSVPTQSKEAKKVTDKQKINNNKPTIAKNTQTTNKNKPKTANPSKTNQKKQNVATNKQKNKQNNATKAQPTDKNVKKTNKNTVNTDKNKQKELNNNKKATNNTLNPVPDNQTSDKNKQKSTSSPKNTSFLDTDKQDNISSTNIDETLLTQIKDNDSVYENKNDINLVEYTEATSDNITSEDNMTKNDTIISPAPDNKLLSMANNTQNNISEKEKLEKKTDREKILYMYLEKRPEFKGLIKRIENSYYLDISSQKSRITPNIFYNIDLYKNNIGNIKKTVPIYNYSFLKYNYKQKNDSNYTLYFAKDGFDEYLTEYSYIIPINDRKGQNIGIAYGLWSMNNMEKTIEIYPWVGVKIDDYQILFTQELLDEIEKSSLNLQNIKARCVSFSGINFAVFYDDNNAYATPLLGEGGVSRDSYYANKLYPLNEITSKLQ